MYSGSNCHLLLITEYSLQDTNIQYMNFSKNIQGMHLPQAFTWFLKIAFTSKIGVCTHTCACVCDHHQGYQ